MIRFGRKDGGLILSRYADLFTRQAFCFVSGQKTQGFELLGWDFPDLGKPEGHAQAVPPLRYPRISCGNLVALVHFMRPSLRKGAHAALSSAVWQEIQVCSVGMTIHMTNFLLALPNELCMQRLWVIKEFVMTCKVELWVCARTQALSPSVLLNLDQKAAGAHRFEHAAKEENGHCEVNRVQGEPTPSRNATSRPATRQVPRACLRNCELWEAPRRADAAIAVARLLDRTRTKTA